MTKYLMQINYREENVFPVKIEIVANSVEEAKQKFNSNDYKIISEGTKTCLYYGIAEVESEPVIIGSNEEKYMVLAAMTNNDNLEVVDYGLSLEDAEKKAALYEEGIEDCEYTKIVKHEEF